MRAGRLDAKGRVQPPEEPESPENESAEGTDGQDPPSHSKEQLRAERRANWAMCLQWIWPFRWKILGMLGLGTVAAGLAMLQPLAMKLIIDGALLVEGVSASERLSRLHLIGSTLLGLILLAKGTELVRDYLLERLVETMTLGLQRRLYERAVRLPLRDLHELKSGGVVSRLTGDVQQTSGLPQEALLSPIMAGLRFLLGLGFLLYLSWPLALGCLVLVPPVVALNALWLRRLRPIYRSTGQDRQEASARATETFGGIRVVRGFGREKTEQREMLVRSHLMTRKSMMAMINRLGITGLWGVLMPGISLMILWLGGALRLNAEAQGGPAEPTIGTLFAYQWYAIMLIQPVYTIVSSISRTQQSIAAMERVFDLMRRPEELPDDPDAVPAPHPVRELRLENVGFGYEPGKPVLQGIDLVAHRGQMTALVGASGAGKTTLVNLIARFYDPTEGAIRLNGVDLRKIKRRSYRQQLGIVEQEVFLFEGTVRENLAYARPSASEEELREAARRSNAEAFILELPEGYDTLIGERGVKLSGGQRQRLSIARALLADPQILILDEATSNLDSESETLIQRALGELFRDRLTFVIAHRLSTITHADLVLVLEAGRVIERGTHEELMQQGGSYHEMVERQRRAFERPGATLSWGP
jgi:ATP-binding cassette subfamily B protein/subfamily B ATP-binding cassette protein MsbA